MKRIFVTAGIRGRRSFEQSRGPQVAVILPCFPRPVEQVFTLRPNKFPVPPWLKHWEPDQILCRCRRHVWPTCRQQRKRVLPPTWRLAETLLPLWCIVPSLRAILTQCLSPSPPTSVTSEWTYGLSPPVTKVTNDSVCLFYMWLKAQPAV